MEHDHQSQSQKETPKSSTEVGDSNVSNVAGVASAVAEKPRPASSTEEAQRSTRSRCRSTGQELPGLFGLDKGREQLPKELTALGIYPNKGYPFFAIYKDKDNAVKAVNKQLNSARHNMSFGLLTGFISNNQGGERQEEEEADGPHQIQTQALVHTTPEASANLDEVFSTPFVTPMNTGYSDRPGRTQNEKFTTYREKRSKARENQLKRADEIQVQEIDLETPAHTKEGQQMVHSPAGEGEDQRKTSISSSSPEVSTSPKGAGDDTGGDFSRSESQLNRVKAPPQNQLEEQTGSKRPALAQSTIELDKLMEERRELLHRTRELEFEVLNLNQGLDKRIQSASTTLTLREYEDSRLRCWKTKTMLTKWAKQMEVESALSTLRRVHEDLGTLGRLIETGRGLIETGRGLVAEAPRVGNPLLSSTLRNADGMYPKERSDPHRETSGPPVKRDLLKELMQPTPETRAIDRARPARGAGLSMSTNTSLNASKTSATRSRGGKSLFELAQEQKRKEESKGTPKTQRSTLASLGDRTIAMRTMRWGAMGDPEVEAGRDEEPGLPADGAAALYNLLQGLGNRGQYVPEYLQHEGDEFYQELPPPWDDPPKHQKPRDYEMKAMDLNGSLPSFSGRQEDYTVFRTRFLLLVHRLDVPLPRKQMCLAAAISNVNGGTLSRFATPDEHGYKLLINQLEAKYGDPQKNLSAHLARIQALPVLSDNNVAALERYIETVESYHAALGATAPSEMESAAHFNLLASKIEGKVMVQFRKTLTMLGLPKPNDPKLLIKYLDEYVLEPLRRAVDGPNPDPPGAGGARAPKGVPGKNQKPYQGRLTEEELDSIIPPGVDRSNLANTRDCPLCVASHSLAQCPQFLNKMNVNQRKSLLVYLDRCFTCLEAGHRNPECPKTRKCNLCPEGHRGDHHPLLHGAVHWRINRKGGKPRKNPQGNEAKRGEVPAEDKGAGPGGNRRLPNREDMAKAAAAPYHFMLRVESTPARASHWSMGVQLPPQLPGQDPDYAGFEPSVFTHPFHGGAASLGFVGARLYGSTLQNVVETIIMLDPGANVTLLREELLDRLEIPAEFGEARVVGVGGHVTTYRSAAVSLTIESLNKNYRAPIQARTMPDPVGELTPTPWHELKHNWNHLKDLNFCKFPPERKVDIIMGTDNPLFHWCLQEVWGESIYDPFARLTVLGWTGFGPTRPEAPEDKSQARIVQNFRVENLQEIQVDEISAEAGIKLCNAEDKRAVQLLQSTTCTREDGKTETSMLWKHDEVRPAPNGPEILKRYQRERTKLEKDPEYWKRYDEAIQKWEQAGVIREIPVQSWEQGYYIPHFGVIREDKETTKLRIVLNCAYQSEDGHCINDFLVKGPRVFNDLVNVLLLFRAREIGLMGDIQQMFLQLKLLPEDRKYVRILFQRYQSKEISAFECLAHMFGKADSPCIAVTLLKKSALENRETKPEAAKAVLRQSIIDDILACVRNALEGQKVKQDLVHIAAELGMQIHKWASNCHGVDGRGRPPSGVLRIQRSRPGKGNVSDSGSTMAS